MWHHFNQNDAWFIVGLLSQGIFFLRFFVQWLASEKEKACVIPISFWYLSLFGGAALLVYAIHIKDPVFIFGQAGGLLIYSRNLMLIKKNQKSGRVDQNL